MQKPSPKPFNITRVLTTVAVTLFIFGAGIKVGSGMWAIPGLTPGSTNEFVAGAEGDQKQVNFSQFWEVWNYINSYYVDKQKLNTQDQFNGAIKGLVASLGDPFTYYLTPKENKAAEEDLQGHFEGIGAQLDQDPTSKIITVTLPMKNSPAEKAGLQKGDVIDKVDGNRILGLSLQEVINKIRGPKGSKVSLSVYRNGEAKTIDIVRDTIQIPTIELTYDRSIAHLVLNQFGADTINEWDKAVAEIRAKYDAKEIKGMILDLRNNPGGYLDAAVYLGGEFLPKGKTIVLQESTKPSENKTFTVDRDGKLLDIPVTVLVNGGSASAAEILSGALKDNGRAQLIGEKTFGKGSVQEVIPLTGGAGLHVTIAKWKLPSGEWIHEKGIQPNIEVKPDQQPQGTSSASIQQKDVQFERAMSLLLEGK